MTIKDCLNRAVTESPEGVALRYKQHGNWQITSFSELRRRVWHVSEMLIRLGVKPGDRVAILLENSPEWFEIYYGIVGIGVIAVPVDAKLREQEVSHIFHDCEVSMVFCSARLAVLIEGIGPRLHELRDMIVLDCEGDVPAGCESLDCHAYAQLWEDASPAAEAEGRAFDRMDPTASSPASFIYTSGTTGRQKGAMLTHHNFMSNVAGIAKAIDVRDTDNFMLVLPLHHSFAFTCNLLLPLYARCEISLVENLKTIKANMADCSPTVLLTVPLLLEKMLARVMDGINARQSARLMYRLGLAKVIGRRIHADWAVLCA
jgi:long-chain acyl-CoA synthetase